MAVLYWMRLAALVLSCVTFGLVTHVGGLEGGVGAWCMFCWIFSFCGTLLILLVDIFDLYTLDFLQDVWINLPVTISSYAAVLCFFASIVFPHIFIYGQQSYDVHSHFIAAEFFSFLALLAYLLELWFSWKTSKCYMATTKGILLVWETFVAAVILFFISNPVSYTDQAAVRWCMAVYCICFICSVTSIIKIVIWDQMEPSCFKFFNLCATVMYFSATIIWPVFKFNSHYPSHIYPPESCQGGLELCPWGRLVVVSVLTALNFLLYSFSLCCSCTSDSTNEHEYSGDSGTSIIQALRSPQLQNQTEWYSSDPGRQLLGNGRRNPRNYLSLNHPNVVVCVSCDSAIINQVHIRELPSD